MAPLLEPANPSDLLAIIAKLQAENGQMKKTLSLHAQAMTDKSHQVQMAQAEVIQAQYKIDAANAKTAEVRAEAQRIVGENYDKAFQ